MLYSIKIYVICKLNIIFYLKIHESENFIINSPLKHDSALFIIENRIHQNFISISFDYY